MNRLICDYDNCPLKKIGLEFWLVDMSRMIRLIHTFWNFNIVLKIRVQ